MFALGSCLFVVLLPSQKAEAQRRKREWGQSMPLASLSVVVLSVAFMCAASRRRAATHAAQHARA
jgi:hypothetical protein